MIERNLSINHEFVCLTENREGLDGVDCIDFPDDWVGWWNKISLFRQGLFAEGATILYFDLDLVITGNIDFLVGDGKTFAIADRFSGPKSYNSSIMRFGSGAYHEVYDRFISDEQSPLKGGKFHGDQDWIYHCIKGAELFPKEKVVSFKRGLESKIDKSLPPDQQSVHLPADVSIVAFHGLPNPVDVENGPYGDYRYAPFIKEHWR